MNITKRCNKSRCNNYISIHDTYCEEHKNDNYKQYDKERTSTQEGKEYKRFYDSKDWRTLRYQTLLNAGFTCVDCMTNEATVGDHIVDTRIDWSLRLDPDNIQALCKGCHNKKTFKK